MEDGDDSAFDFMGYLPELCTTMDNTQDESNISGIEPTWGNEASYYKSGQPDEGSLTVSSDQMQQRQIGFSGMTNVSSGSSFLTSVNEADLSSNIPAPMRDGAESPLQIIPSSNPNSPQTASTSEDLSSAIVEFIEQPDGSFAPITKYPETQSGHHEVFEKWLLFSISNAHSIFYFRAICLKSDPS
jgi:hypothetical protein